MGLWLTRVRISSPPPEFDIVDTCPSCGGNWLDAGEFKRILDIRMQTFKDEDKQFPGAKQAVPTKAGQPQQPLVCPICLSVDMKVVDFGGSTGVLIDRCPKCDGIWLDMNELEQVQILVEEWEKKDTQIERQLGPLLAELKETRDTRRKEQVDAVLKAQSQTIKIPSLMPLVKAIAYRLVK